MKSTGVMIKIIPFLYLSLISPAYCDIYLHNPRGSNNRLDEAGRERNNGNRLFDSQNNNRGGYNVGSLYYYQGSKLSIEWTNQHSCQSPNGHCEFILQYMCSDQLRDGVSTTAIPSNPVQCKDYDCNNDRRYGMHENYDYYLNCKLRQRNKGLFTADQINQNQRNRDRAINTRQNPQGTRRGYECPEERDYYPYWHPTPWKDIAVLTNDATRCPYYQSESQNVQGKWYCDIPKETIHLNQKKGLLIPNNKEDCEKFVWPLNSADGVNGTWKEAPSHSLPAPTCRETEFTRDNHLGNGVGGYPILFNWTVPETMEGESCALRIRYNISTADYEAWNGKTNASHSQVKNNQGTLVDMTDKYEFSTKTEADNRGYIFENNPQVKLFNDLDFDLQLAINTAQYGRTFQDRTHHFAVRPHPSDLAGSNIKNLNVRGKRGNIVQVYPAVEYDFVPNTLEIAKGDYIHFQWTGSNTNPNNNDGQGKAGTDRSNIVLQAAQAYAEGTFNHSNKHGHWGRSYPAHFRDVTFMGMSAEDLKNLALLSPNQFRGEMSELDDAGTYFDIGPRKITSNGTYHYMCTRNNNFSNRSQKGKLISQDFEVLYESIGWNGGSVKTNGMDLVVARGTFDSLKKMKVEKIQETEVRKRLAGMDRTLPFGDGMAGDAFVIHPQEKMTSGDKMFKVKMAINPPASTDVGIYRSNNDAFATWTRVDAQISGKEANFATDSGGVYVAVYYRPVGMIVGVTLAVLAIAVIVIGSVVYFRRNPEKWEQCQGSLKNVKRSTQGQV